MTRIAYQFDLMPVESRDALDNITRADIDWRVMQPFRVTDANGNRTEVVYDALARVAAHATRGPEGTALGGDLAGLDPDPDDTGFTPVTVDLPFRSAQAITLHRMSGEATAHNLHADNVTVETLPLSKLWRGQQLHVDPSTGGAAQGLPPSSVFLYVFEGVDADTARPPRSRPRRHRRCSP